jgi:sulfoquinovosidase
MHHSTHLPSTIRSPDAARPCEPQAEHHHLTSSLVAAPRRRRYLAGIGLALGLAAPIAIGGCSGAGTDHDTSDVTAGPKSGVATLPCGLDGAVAYQSLTAQTATVGDFKIQIGATGGVDVTSTSTGARSVFATPTDGVLVSASSLTLNAPDKQGSFTVTERVTTMCAEGHITKIAVQNGALRLSGGFTDENARCKALTFEAGFCQASPGHLSFGVKLNDLSFNSVTLRAAADSDERIYGAGEQFAHDSLNLRGRKLPILAQEGGVGRGQPIITKAVNLVSPGSGGSEDSTYYAAPQYLTSKNRSVFLDNTEYTLLDFSPKDHLEMHVAANRVSGQILAGNSPLELIERLTESVGRMPPPPDWVNQGAIVALAKPLKDSLDIVSQLKAHGAEIGGVWNQTWAGLVKTSIGEQVLWNWTLNASQFPDWAPFSKTLAEQGSRVLCYVNPMLRNVTPDLGQVSRNLYQEAVKNKYLVRKADGSPYLIQMTSFSVGLVDLANEAARKWMKDVIKVEMIEKAGCSGWMADFAEALPFDAVLGAGISGADFHNQYPVAWMRLNREAIEEAGKLGDILIWNRSGGLRTPGYSTMMWEGDQLITWDKYDGIVSALHGLLSGGFSGIALNHSDTGGYTSLTKYGLGYSREPELMKRWTEMNAFTALLRTHEGNQPKENGQVYSDSAAQDHFARFTKVFKALAFYRTTLYDEATKKGYPVVRHLMMHYPTDMQSMLTDDEFLLGSEILVAPMLTKCATVPLCSPKRAVYLPPGQWVHLWTGKPFGSVGAGTTLTMDAPLGELPVFYKAGSSVGSTFVKNLKAAGINAG